MSLQVCHGSYDFRNAGLVVRTEKRSPVSNNQILTDVVLEFREIRRTEDYALLLIENYVIAVVIRHDAGIHMLAAHVRSRVHMGYEADRGDCLVCI